jgi:20S proteasome subunit beta 7
MLLVFILVMVVALMFLVFVLVMVVALMFLVFVLLVMVVALMFLVFVLVMVVALVILVFILIVLVALMFLVFVLVMVVALVILVFILIVLVALMFLVPMSRFYRLYNLFQAFFSGNFTILYFMNNMDERLDDFNFLGVSCAKLYGVNHISQFNDGGFITRGVLHKFVKPRLFKAQANAQNQVCIGNSDDVLSAGLERVRIRAYRQQAEDVHSVAAYHSHPVGDYVRCCDDANLLNRSWRARGSRGGSRLWLRCSSGPLWLLRCGGRLWLRCSGGRSWLLRRGGHLRLCLRRSGGLMRLRRDRFTIIGTCKKKE